MAVNKVEYAGMVLLDLTSDTVSADKMLSGTTAHAKTGESVTGTIPTKGWADLVFDGSMGHAFVTPGYYPEQVMKSIPLETKTITENGTYVPNSGNAGFSSVNVDVPTGGVTRTTLWINPSSTSSFSAQTVTLKYAIEGYDLIEIEWKPTYNGSYTNRKTYFDPNGAFFGTLYYYYFGGRPNESTSGNRYARSVCGLGTSLEFTTSQAQGATGSSVNHIVPVKITGIKF